MGSVDDDDESGGAFASFGMAYSDLVELLAATKISADGLESVLKTNKGLSQREIALILVALENYKTLYDMLSLSGTIPKSDVMRCVRKMFAKIDMLAQLDFLRGNIIQNSQKTQKPIITFIEDPDPLVKGLFGDEGI